MRITFLAQLEVSGQVGPSQEGSQINGNFLLAQEVRAIALALSELLEALNARQWSW
jgi:hypothetical protein